MSWRIVDGAPVPVDDDPAPAGPDDVVIEVDGAWLVPGLVSPVVAGSAAVGRVVDAGAHARARIGTRVAVGPHLPCGECEVCRRGGAAVCPRGGVLGVDRRGTLAERVTVPARWVIELGDDLPGPAAAAVPGDVAIAYAMYARASIGPRQPAVVLGDDAVARFLVQILAAKGITRVDHADPVHPDKPLYLFATTAAARPLALAASAPRTTLITRATLGAGVDPGIALGSAHLAHEVTVHAVAGAHPDLLVELAALVIKAEVSLDGIVRVVPRPELAAALASPDPSRSLVIAMR